MATYQWQGRTRSGETRTGILVADSQAAATAQLRQQMIMPMSIRPKLKELREYLPFLESRIKIKQVVVFTRQFATMIDAGLPLVQCLTILASQQEKGIFKRTLTEVKADVESGSTFSEALAKHPKAFDRLYTSLVESGETGGILDTILTRLANYLEKAEALRRKVKGAMVYPVSVLVVAILVVVLMLIKVIPVFEQMFADFGGVLPGPTQLVIDISHFLQASIHWLALGAVAAFFGFRQLRKTDQGRLWTDGLALKIPVIGGVLRKVAVARFSRTLGTMLSSGVAILDALEIVARTAGNLVLERAILKTKASIAEGKTIAEPLAETKVFPGMVVQMISVGEQTGNMDTMLQKIADFYEDEVDAAVDAMTAMLEPAMMVVLGGTIGLILIAMYLPIFKIADNIN
ncbi:MAG: type II secretion system F family protein [Myxococcales bacterium]|nr:type II secretion system F family protein [Myxococcales bacterium]